MIDTSILFQLIPIALGVSFFLCKTKQQMVSVNFLLCVSWVFAFAINGAFAGAFAALVAGASSLYSAITNKTINKLKALLIITLMLFSIMLINTLESVSFLISLMPLIAFAIYRYGELSFDEKGYRWLSVLGGSIYVLYALISNSWGVAISESLLIIANIYHLKINFYSKSENLIDPLAEQ